MPRLFTPPTPSPPEYLIGFARITQVVLSGPGEQLLHLLHTSYATVKKMRVAAYVSTFDGILGDIVTSAPSQFRSVITADLVQNHHQSYY